MTSAGTGPVVKISSRQLGTATAGGTAALQYCTQFYLLQLELEECRLGM